MPEDIYEQDRFYYLGRGYILWMYHNPDANSGDQFVSNYFGTDLLMNAVRGHDNQVDVFSWIGSECKQYCSDIGAEDYEWCKEQFESDPFAIGCTWQTLTTILCRAIEDMQE